MNNPILPLCVHLVFLMHSRYPFWDQVSALQSKTCMWVIWGGGKSVGSVNMAGVRLPETLLLYCLFLLLLGSFSTFFCLEQTGKKARPDCSNCICGYCNNNEQWTGLYGWENRVMSGGSVLSWGLLAEWWLRCGCRHIAQIAFTPINNPNTDQIIFRSRRIYTMH